MPRVSFKTVRQALKQSPLLPPLLKATNSLEHAANELRWIKAELPAKSWVNAVLRRSRLEPLQYILGTQPFGPLDIRCKRNVLIPRWETEEWALKLGYLLADLKQPVKVLDACTGTGCIPLLVKTMAPKCQVLAFDYSADACLLATENKRLCQVDVDIWQGDVFDVDNFKHESEAQLVTSNPPYVFRDDYDKPLAVNGVEQSVRLYEPADALIGGVEFYEHLMENVVKPLNATGFVFELGYKEQVLATSKLLPKGWEWRTYYDSNKKLRCVVAWKNGSSMEILSQLV